MEYFNSIPKDLINFLLVFVFSFLIGLEQTRIHSSTTEPLFGTYRTFTIIGIIGFVLYVLNPTTMLFFFSGGAILSLLLSLYYFQKIKTRNQWGITTILIALLTYCLTPLVYSQPKWMVMLIVVIILVVVEVRESLFNFSQKFDRNEFTTLAKFILIVGIILPLLPYEPISNELNISPYKIWLSIVVVSSISYLSYLLKKFIFPNSGIFLSAILGGIYSSTATTIILAKKSKETDEINSLIIGIFLATIMMYIRIFLLALFFNYSLSIKLLPYFILYILSLLMIIAFFLKNKNSKLQSNIISENYNQNPLEFKTALVFGLLFGFFSVVTHYVSNNYGNLGMTILSFIVGITDIDPFILNLFQNSNSTFSPNMIAIATIIASASNNFIKMIYAISVGNKSIRKQIIIGFSILFAINMVSVMF